MKAWGLCGAEQRAVLEAAGIQDLMRRCVLVAAPPMHANLLRVLRAFHAERGSNGIAEMLCRLYEPILWPHLNYANARVRANALAVMFDAFPIQVRHLRRLSHTRLTPPSHYVPLGCNRPPLTARP